MLYQVEFSDEAREELESHRNSGNMKLYDKILSMAAVLAIDPRAKWVGKPERLKHKKIETWSRRINDYHRMVYEIDKSDVFIVSVWGHYEDK